MTTDDPPTAPSRSPARPARITREEIATPPEFADFRPVGHEAARVGGARIELIAEGPVNGDGHGPTTRLGTCYQQIPVRLMPPFALQDEPASLLYLINLTAGLLDGDAHLLEVHARAGTRTVVTGQSAARIHPSRGSFATQQWNVQAEDDTCLVVLPGPTIPYAGTRYYQRGRVDLAPSARLIWGDIWHAGRYARGALSERFAFDRIIQDFELRRDGQLLYRERFAWNGPWTDDDVSWYVGGALATASLVIAGPFPDDLPIEAPDVRGARMPLDHGVTCLRWCGAPTAVTNTLVAAAMAAAGAWTGGPGAPPWLLHSSELAPNHWFSKPSEGT